MKTLHFGPGIGTRDTKTAIFGIAESFAHNLTGKTKRCTLFYKHFVGVVESWWAPRSSNPLGGAAEVALVGSTPIHSRSVSVRLLAPIHVPSSQRRLARS